MPFAQFWSGKRWLDGFMLLPDARRNMLDLATATVAISLLSLAIPLVVMQVYDRIIPNNSSATLLWLLVGASLAIVLEAVMRWARFVMTGRMTAQFEHLLGCDVIKKIIASRIVDFERNSVGEHLDRMGAVSTLSSFYIGQTVQTAVEMPFTLLFLAAVYYLGGWLVAIPIGLIAAYLALVSYTRKRYATVHELSVEQTDRRYDFVIQVLQGLHLIKAQTLEEQMMRRYERLQAGAASANMESGFWSKLPAEAGLAFSQLSMFSIIAFGSGAVLGGTLTVGGLSACMMLAARALGPAQNAAQFWFRFSEAELAHERLNTVQHLPSDVEPGMPLFPRSEASRSIHLRNVSFAYGPDQAKIIDDLSLDIQPGKFVGIVGKSATGTSTLLYLMMGLLRPSSGAVYVGDYDLAKFDTTDMRGCIEYVPPRGVLYTGSIIDNIALFDPLRYDAALDAAALLGLDEPVAMLPQGYETQVDNQSSTILSRGLVQQIAFARALTVRPGILLIDKTTGALDQDSRESYVWLLKHLHHACTVVMVTSEPAFLREMDVVYEIDGGHLAERSLIEDTTLFNKAMSDDALF